MYKSEFEDGSLVLGTITLKALALDADITSTRCVEELQSRPVELFGELGRLPLTPHQTLEQVMADHRENGPAPEALGLPPEAESHLLAEIFDQHHRGTLDQPIGMLDDRTPRKVGKTPQGREQVAARLKDLEHGETKTRAGREIPLYHFSWMWKELGIPEAPN